MRIMMEGLVSFVDGGVYVIDRGRRLEAVRCEGRRDGREEARSEASGHSSALLPHDHPLGPERVSA